MKSNYGCNSYVADRRLIRNILWYILVKTMRLSTILLGFALLFSQASAYSIVTFGFVKGDWVRPLHNGECKLAYNDQITMYLWKYKMDATPIVFLHDHSTGREALLGPYETHSAPYHLDKNLRDQITESGGDQRLSTLRLQMHLSEGEWSIVLTDVYTTTRIPFVCHKYLSWFKTNLRCIF
jgi:hypothetical protein